MRYIKHFSNTLLALFLSLGILNAQSKSETIAKLDSMMDDLEANNELMGTLTISRNGQVVYDRQVGFANIDQGNKIGPTTLMKIGSNTKVFTAVMVFQLIDEGKLSLDTKLSRFHPKVKNADQITISQLLSHRSGIFNMTADEAFEEYRVSGLTADQQLQKIAAYPSVFEPGSQYEYSNTNYILLSHIIEKITSKSYGQNLADRITVPLGLAHTAYGPDAGIMEKTASGYYYEDGWNEITTTSMNLPRGAGAIVSTSTELNIFFRALMQGKLVSKNSLSKMTEFRDGRGRGINDFVVPPSITTEKGVSHGGQIDGFLAQPIYFIDMDVALTFISNGLNCDPQKLTALLATYLKNPF
ncbi:MAG: beta-lactamase family protein [Roseivirga sp.]|nr:beta-lactamase family protein [Roseivirga sp.]